jgi:hypothetical protein
MNSYRPISLTSCMCKTMEKIINRPLLQVIVERRLLPETKYGFRKNRSTTDVLITLDSLNSEAIRKKEYAELLSLDISKAYDTCWWYGILKQWKIDGKILQFIKNFMSNRKLRVAVGNYSSNPKEIKKGLVQGAVLSVTTFLIAMADIVNEIKETCTILRYADDWVIETSSKAPITTENQTATLGWQAITVLEYHQKRQ